MSHEVTMKILRNNVRILVIQDNESISISMLEDGLKELLYHAKSHDTKSVVGLNVTCSFNPSMARGRPPALLQLCSGSFCVIIQLNYFNFNNIPSCLGNFLELNYITFVGVGMSKKLEKLGNLYDLECSNYFELGPLAAEVNQRPHLSACGLLELFKEVYYRNLEIEIPESVVSSDYTREMEEHQIQHAAVDAHVPFLIGQKLLGGNFISRN